MILQTNEQILCVFIDKARKTKKKNRCNKPYFFLTLNLNAPVSLVTSLLIVQTIELVYIERPRVVNFINLGGGDPLCTLYRAEGLYSVQGRAPLVYLLYGTDRKILENWVVL